MISMRSIAAAIALAVAATGLVAPMVTAASEAPTSRQAASQPRHPDDLGADEGHLLGMQEPYALILLLGGLLASLILIRGPALRRASESVKRIPGDAP
jgi:hypothetical protein